ncbi:Serine/threonine-protein kinase pkn1 [Tritonibacter multivorans]|uniref:Serine/threonine-protein kinase pkn1 n=1 Tax=Tritonibacter multivorans TaxID=928856 RepID=A0A0P1GNK3_9RHOB|nr:formylglycine-generating enzyme family protein [Tritonibacter multivorans]MDA7419806.1 formylglycine-generating enzyme family protein [Tritonibacter multivorans]CUH76215.1 Serine/threonine-protein kinase pkn1 [Tritonibacter multivorans]SFC53113.1 Formylglycine-generating enzyme, required for sulfatase activity, contains SUMF1/FGE domain [Tritonibacter multivorans]
MTKDTKQGSCCSPARRAGADAPPAAPIVTCGSRIPEDALRIPGGRSLTGTNHPEILHDGEDPFRNTRVTPFRIGATTVTNAQFAAFIRDTNYLTEAERFGWSFVFWMQVPEALGPTLGVKDVEWWRRVDGANWRDINGPGTMETAWRPDHPVVHVSWNDAQAYAKWAGGRLPTEIEWEHAARGGLGDVRFPWGDREPDDATFQPCNIWQGDFPKTNSAKDGFVTTAPARHYEPNGYGLYNVVGNVWEWTADAYRIKSLKKHVRQRLAAMKGYKLSKGGSFLCHASYCYRYRIAARSGTSPDSTTTHQGFRVVWSE